MAERPVCPNCEQVQLEIFYEQCSVPTNSCILFKSADEAHNYPRGDIKLGFCSVCGFISNIAFDSHLTEYSGRYEETQSYSATFNTFHKQLVERLIDRYALRQKDVLEIGCGKGEFLALLCALGGNRGIGFDPGFDDSRQQVRTSRRIKFIKDFFSERYSGYGSDFVCCKMTLEHIARPRQFLRMIRSTVKWKSNAVVFFQVPEATRIFRSCALEDIYYEHCSYFSHESLRYLFESTGFEVIRLDTAYGGQYLTIEARPVLASEGLLRDPADLEEMKRYTANFEQRAQKRSTQWLMSINNNKPQRIVLWGSGSKAVALLSLLDQEVVLEYVVDINPHRQGSYMAGTGQQIVSPEYLQSYRPDLVMAMNPIYRQEIVRDLATLGLTPEVITA
jgi:SAM-dependent methyltransferase